MTRVSSGPGGRSGGCRSQRSTPRTVDATRPPFRDRPVEGGVPQRATRLMLHPREGPEARSIPHPITQPSPYGASVLLPVACESYEARQADARQEAPR